MLLNLSNHPATGWSPEQAGAAEKAFGRVEDLPFPNVPPSADEAEVDRLVGIFFDKIAGMGPSAVHIMGEMTFSFRLISRLKSAGIPCLASTTDRLVEERGGRKIVQFRFVRFRYY
ncbi:MAG: CRISPR-associated protein [Bacteroidetes bacterium]|nr:MAG: CRISPR-associated protein [Bacteroidota bacterium]